jgi:hypothetical protein
MNPQPDSSNPNATVNTTPQATVNGEWKEFIGTNPNGDTVASGWEYSDVTGETRWKE